MTVNANYNPACYPTYTTKFVDIKVAVPFNGALLNLGVNEDLIRPREELLTNPVFGDVNGGQGGAPIEMQDLGEIHYVQLNLTSFTKATHEILLSRGLRATPGTITSDEIGQFMMTANAVRLLLNTAEVEDTRNYWCALPIQPIEYGMGTKSQVVSYGFVCHRPPCGHPKAGILYDTDSDAYS